MSLKHTKIILFGPPASGKGTQAKVLAKLTGLPHISTGDILRNLDLNTDLGRQAKSFMDQGKLVPAEMAIQLTLDRLKKPDCQKGFILDGFPRSLEQAEALKKFLGGSDYIVIYFTLTLKEAVDRIAGRASCPQCKKPYNDKKDPPKKSGICDNCRVPLVKRDDDNEATAAKRFQVYNAETAPLLARYKKSGKLVELDATKSIEAVSKELKDLLAA